LRVQRVVRTLLKRLEALEARLNQNSSNSSRSPSTDAPSGFATLCEEGQVMTPLGERIEALRRDKGWNWKELARRSRLHTQSIYKIVHGERADPRLSVIVRLALAFGVGVDTLLGSLEVYATAQDTVDGVSPTAPNGSPRPTRRRKTTPRPESA
jgi:transcriptional regulator with XRE-family HTH domain